jgi:hypothetical protein
VCGRGGEHVHKKCKSLEGIRAQNRYFVACEIQTAAVARTKEKKVNM